MLRGAEIVLQCLRAEGIDLVFGYPGGAIMPLYDALEGSGIKHILTRHEQGAVFAAEGVARVSGKVGVAFATSGPVKFTPHAKPADVHGESTFTETLITLLEQAKKPVALVGAGAKLSGAIPELRRLLDYLQIPTFATVHGLGAVPTEAPYYLGMVGMHGTRAANMALHENDVLLVVGARLDDRVTGDPTRFAPHSRIVT